MAEKSDLYIKLDEHVRTEKKDVPLSKVAGVYCQDEELKSQAEKVIVYSFQEGEKEKAKKQVLLRLAPSLWDEISAWAEDDFRSINAQIEYLLTEAVRNRRKGK